MPTVSDFLHTDDCEDVDLGLLDHTHLVRRGDTQSTHPSPTKNGLQKSVTLYTQSSDSDAESNLRSILRDVLRSELKTLKDDLKNAMDDMLQKVRGFGIFEGQTSQGLGRDSESRISFLTSSRSSKSQQESYAWRKGSLESIGSRMSDPPVRATRTFQESLFDAVSENQLQTVEGMLAGGADPNSILESYRKAGSSKEILDCSLLAAAVLGSHVDMVRLLGEYAADPNSRYSFRAGSRAMLWSGSAIYACIPSGNLDMFRQLVELNADPKDVSTNNANLIWQSCYFGHTHVLSCLLQLNVDCNLAGQSQDFVGVSYTPMHLAAMNDHETILKSLITAKASIDNKNEEGKTPLISAMLKERIIATRTLVAAGANLFHEHTNSEICDRPVDILFRVRNPLLLRAAAVGLQEQERQAQSCSLDDLLHFIRCSLAKSEILKALFKHRKLRFWNATDGVMEVKSGYIRKHVLLHGGQKLFFINVSTSTHAFWKLEQAVKARQEPDSDTKTFLQNLVPQTPQHAKQVTTAGYKLSMTHLQVFEAMVADMHFDLRIIRAIADASVNDDFFLLKPCQAILQNAWQHFWIYTMWEEAMQVSLLVVFCLMAAHMKVNPDCWYLSDCSSDELEQEFRLLTGCGAPFYFAMLLREVLIFMAYVHYGWKLDYLRTARALYKIFIAVLNGGILFSVIILGARTNFYFRVVFAIACVFKWMEAIYCLTPIRRFGAPFMPIFYTIHNIWAFATIYALYVLAFTTALCALALKEEIWLDSLINVVLFSTTAEPGFLPHVAHPELASEREEWMLGFLFITSVFVVSVVLMNCFIAAMTTSFKMGVTNRQKLFQQHLAIAVCTHMAMRHSIFRICRLCSRCRARRSTVATYLWYAAEMQ